MTRIPELIREQLKLGSNYIVVEDRELVSFCDVASTLINRGYQPCGELLIQELAPSIVFSHSRAYTQVFLKVKSDVDDVESIPIITHCPRCGVQHIDKAEEQCDYKLPDSVGGMQCQLPAGHTDPNHAGGPRPLRWTNPPHKSHLCANERCIDAKGNRTVWRPADVPTVGVESIETRGANDNWPVIMPSLDEGG